MSTILTQSGDNKNSASGDSASVNTSDPTIAGNPGVKQKIKAIHETEKAINAGRKTGGTLSSEQTTSAETHGYARSGNAGGKKLAIATEINTKLAKKDGTVKEAVFPKTVLATHPVITYSQRPPLPNTPDILGPDSPREATLFSNSLTTEPKDAAPESSSVPPEHPKKTVLRLLHPNAIVMMTRHISQPRPKNIDNANPDSDPKKASFEKPGVGTLSPRSRSNSDIDLGGGGGRTKIVLPPLADPTAVPPIQRNNVASDGNKVNVGSPPPGLTIEIPPPSQTGGALSTDSWNFSTPKDSSGGRFSAQSTPRGGPKSTGSSSPVNGSFDFTNIPYSVGVTPSVGTPQGSPIGSLQKPLGLSSTPVNFSTALSGAGLVATQSAVTTATEPVLMSTFTSSQNANSSSVVGGNSPPGGLNKGPADSSINTLSSSFTPIQPVSLSSLSSILNAGLPSTLPVGTPPPVTTTILPLTTTRIPVTGGDRFEGSGGLGGGDLGGGTGGLGGGSDIIPPSFMRPSVVLGGGGGGSGGGPIGGKKSEKTIEPILSTSFGTTFSSAAPRVSNIDKILNAKPAVAFGGGGGGGSDQEGKSFGMRGFSREIETPRAPSGSGFSPNNGAFVSPQPAVPWMVYQMYPVPMVPLVPVLAPITAPAPAPVAPAAEKSKEVAKLPAPKPNPPVAKQLELVSSVKIPKPGITGDLTIFDYARKILHNRAHKGNPEHIIKISALDSLCGWLPVLIIGLLAYFPTNARGILNVVSGCINAAAETLGLSSKPAGYGAMEVAEGLDLIYKANKNVFASLMSPLLLFVDILLGGNLVVKEGQEVITKRQLQEMYWKLPLEYRENTTVFNMVLGEKSQKTDYNNKGTEFADEEDDVVANELSNKIQLPVLKSPSNQNIEKILRDGPRKAVDMISQGAERGMSRAQ